MKSEIRNQKSEISPTPSIHPLTPGLWPAFAELFGPKGACAGCWCLWWRLPRAAWNQGRGAPNRQTMRRLVQKGAIPGLLALEAGRAVGWIALAPRTDYPALARSRILAPVDPQPVWSITCFYVAPSHRGRGLTVELLEAAARHARQHGATLLEGYPVEPAKTQPAPFVFTGLASAFRRAGFREVARRSPTRPIMRRTLSDTDLNP